MAKPIDTRALYRTILGEDGWRRYRCRVERHVRGNRSAEQAAYERLARG